MTTNTPLSRRALLAISAAALAGTPTIASAAPAPTVSAAMATGAIIPDPAFDAIRACQAALNAYRNALDEVALNEDEDPRLLENQATKAMDASLDAWRALFNVTPTTPAGAAALASYMLTYSRDEGGADTADEALDGLASCLHRFSLASA